MSSQLPATTAKSWLIKRSAVPNSARSRRKSARIPASTVTSSAVVGSSAINSPGPAISAIAISTRWRSPPDSSCGYCCSRAAGSGTCTRSSIASAAWRAAAAPSGRCARTVSVSCVPILRCGVSAACGSWNTKPTRAPRMAVRRAADAPTSSSPARRMLPEATAPGARRPGIASASWLLPAPDSPTMPRLPPRASARLTPATAHTGGAAPGKPTVSSSISSRAGSALTGIHQVAQPVAHDSERQHDRDQEGARREQHPRRRLHLARALRHQVAEARGRLLHAQAEK